AADASQVLYAGLLEALGYSRNRQPFRLLAAHVPLAAVAGAREPGAIAAVLHDAAGLVPPAGLVEAAGLLRRPSSDYPWTTLGVRPDNWPLRRSTQVSAILARLAGRLLDELLAPLLDAPLDAQAVRAIWLEQLRELGPQRADAAAVNVLLPFAAAYGQAT